MKTIEVLRKGRERVARGWWDGSGERPIGTDCTATAIGNMEGGGVMLDDVFPACKAQLNITLGRHEYDPVSGWNDAPGRTQAEVVALFDATIARLEREAGGE